SIQQGIYSDAANAKTYGHLNQLADIILDAGFSAIVDATFIRQADRRQIAQLATRRKCPFNILGFQLNEELFRQRIKRRAKQRDRLSDADEKVLDFQLTSAQPLTAAEKNISITVDELSTVEAVTTKINKSAKPQTPL
ncbi:MAG: ATP-binding protein, partial [Pelovirga sp.]